MTQANTLLDITIAALEELKAKDIVILDVSSLSSEMDTLVIASGSSNRQTKALANNVVVKAKANGFKPRGLEGTEQGEWVLVDLGDIIVHIMTPATRDFYDLEGLWQAHSDSTTTTITQKKSSTEK